MHELHSKPQLYFGAIVKTNLKFIGKRETHSLTRFRKLNYIDQNITLHCQNFHYIDKNYVTHLQRFHYKDSI